VYLNELENSAVAEGGVGAEDPVQPRDVVPAREEDEDAALAAKLRLEDVLEQVDDEVVVHLRNSDRERW
jgi:hypothetical protein